MGGRGSSSATNKTWKNRSVQQDKKLKSIANKIRGYKNEQFFVVDDNGEVVMHKKGKGGEVSYTIGEARENFGGNITIHNHPHGGTFSSDDIRAFAHGAKEIQVVTKEGTYILTNRKFGTKEQYNGWYDMKNVLEQQQSSFIDSWQASKMARQQPQAQRIRQQMDRIAKAWNNARNNGVPNADDMYRNKYDTLQRNLLEFVDKESDRILYRQYDDFYRKNARTYGFSYSFVKK